MAKKVSIRNVGNSFITDNCISLSEPSLRSFRLIFFQREEAGFLQGIGFFPKAPTAEGEAAGGAGFSVEKPLGPGSDGAVGVAAAVFGELLVADEAVDPEIDDVDFQGVVAGLCGWCPSEEMRGNDPTKKFPLPTNMFPATTSSRV
jgi:hypothetical protein